MKKTKQNIKKALCLLISALMLNASLPMQVSAQVVIRDETDLQIYEKHKAEHVGGRTIYRMQDMYPILEDEATGEIKFLRPLSQENLREILENPELTEKIFGEVDTYAKFARVQAVQAKGGEEIVTVLADGTKETKNVAKAGDWIVTNPGGEQYIVPEAKFAKKYEKAADLGDGWYKPTGGAADFRQIKHDMNMLAPWGEEQVLKKGAYINVTDINDLYGVAEAEFNDTYKTIKQLYRENFNAIERLVSKIETRLAQRHPKYKGVFFKRFLRNDVNFMKKELENKAAKRAARLARRNASKTALRTFGGVFVGVGVFLGVTLWAAPKVKGQAITVQSRKDAIKDTVQGMEDAEKKELAENVMFFTDQNNYAVIADNARHGDGVLLEQMGLYEPTITASGLSEDEAVDAIIDSAEEEIQIPLAPIEDRLDYQINNFEQYVK